MITELQGRKMSNEQVLEVLKKSCESCGQVLIHAQYNSATLELTVLVDAVKDFGKVDTDMDNVLIGLCDFDFNPVEDTRLQLINEPFCPATIVTCDSENYMSMARSTGGTVLI